MSRTLFFDDAKPLTYSRALPYVLTKSEMEAVAAFVYVETCKDEDGTEFARVAHRTTYEKQNPTGTSVWVKVQ